MSEDTTRPGRGERSTAPGHGSPTPAPTSGSLLGPGVAERPPRTEPSGPVVRWLRRATLGLAAVTVLLTLALFPSLPERIPTHYNILGEPDAWGAPASIFFLLGIFVAMAAGLSWLSLHPRVFNYPRELTEDNAQAMYRAGEEMIVFLNAGCAVLFSGILASMLFSLNPNAIVLPGLALLVGSIVVGLVRMMRV